MKNLKGSIHIAFFSLLILNMLLILGGIFSYFFKVTDHTLLAGIIAFIGAIFGGSVTLIGVNMSINEARRKDELELLEEKIFAGEYLLDELSELLSTSESSLISIKCTYDELEERSPFDVFDAISKKHTKFSKETNQIHDGIVSSELTKKLGYSIYKEIKELSGVNMVGFEVDGEGYDDDDLLQDIEHYISVINELKTKFEKIHNDNLKRYKELIKQ